MIERAVPQQVLRYLAQECEWQRSGERSVAWMGEAWSHAYNQRFQPITYDDILTLGALVEPVKNAHGIRKINVTVGISLKLNPRLIEESLHPLVDNQPDLRCPDEEATEWFRQYEEIHPFRDGNGRTGSLLWNWLRGSLGQPRHVPNLWFDPRRELDDEFDSL